MPNDNNMDENRDSGLEWPNCPFTSGNCIEFDFATLLGQRVNQLLKEFIWKRADGSRLTLHKSQKGFSVQVTGEVHYNDMEEQVDIEQFRALKERLDLLKNSNYSDAAE